MALAIPGGDCIFTFLEEQWNLTVLWIRQRPQSLAEKALTKKSGSDTFNPGSAVLPNERKHSPAGFQS